MSKGIAVADLLAEPLDIGLELLEGRKDLSRRILEPRVSRASATRPRPGAVVLVEGGQLRRLARATDGRLDSWGSAPVAALIVTGARAVPAALRAFSRKRRVPLLRAASPASRVARRLNQHLAERLLPAEIVHGVLMDIAGMGTLILGESGIGKSESALDLIERGHRLVADDIVEIRRGPRGLVGKSPGLMRFFMELRGLGIVNVRDLFGAKVTRLQKTVDLVVLLERGEPASEVERLGLDDPRYPILGEPLPLVRMPVGPGRNLAMLIEVAARNQLLKRQGRHSAHRLVERMFRKMRPRNE